MPDERQLTAQLHELLSFLGQRNVATILVFGQQGMLGSQMASPVDTSYLADTIVLMQFFESSRTGAESDFRGEETHRAHEDTIRELAIGPGGLVGKALTEFHGVLTGVPIMRIPRRCCANRSSRGVIACGSPPPSEQRSGRLRRTRASS